MTDGIIQKVLKEYQNTLTNISFRDAKIMQDIEDKLIEEIKREFPITTPFVHVHGNHTIQQKLIGDNQ